MISKKHKRLQAYQFILQKLQSSGLPVSHTANNTAIESDSICLAELYELKSGLADPSDQLVTSFKAVLGHLVTEEEIIQNLVLPFRSTRQKTE